LFKDDLSLSDNKRDWLSYVCMDRLNCEFKMGSFYVVGCALAFALSIATIWIVLERRIAISKASKVGKVHRTNNSDN
jgi:hypothetical protein